jgi:hypothetical protein
MSSTASATKLPLPADDVTHEAMFSRRPRRPSFAFSLALDSRRGRREGRVPAAPMGPAREKDAGRVNHRYRRRHSGLPCANGLRLIRALPGEPAVATVAFAKPSGFARTWRLLRARQDHTTSPSAARFHQEPRRLNPQQPKPGKTTSNIASPCDASRGQSHSASRFVTLATRPSGRNGTGRSIGRFRISENRNIFCVGD